MTSVAAPVNWTQPGLLAMTETDGHGDTCGPIVIADYLHITQGMPLTTAQIDSLRSQYIAAGLMNTPGVPGMTMTALVAALDTFHGVKALGVEPWDQADINTLHQNLRTIFAAHWAVIIETANAAALPDNQPGVAFHFILVWGLDSNLGYYTCNGDTLTALAAGGYVEPRYYTWADLVACQPRAFAVLPAFTPPAPPPPAEVEDEDIPGIIADLNNAAAAIASALKKVQAG